MYKRLLRTDANVTSYSSTPKSVIVETDDGNTFEGSGLIGADGLWSKIRANVIGDGDPVVSGHIAYRAVLPVDEVPQSLSKWMEDVVLWAGPRNHLVHYKLRRGELFNIVAVFHSKKYVEGWDEFGDPDELYNHFKGARPEVRALLKKIDVWKMWVLCDRIPKKEWTKGRVTLLGDAAHPMLQYLAAGAGMAMEDAVCLAACFDNYRGDEEMALQKYQSLRIVRTARVQLGSRLIGEYIYHPDGVIAQVRNQAISDLTPEQWLSLIHI